MLQKAASRNCWPASVSASCAKSGLLLELHQGVQSISPATLLAPHTAMEPGMITSIEPGIYRAGRWGVRTSGSKRLPLAAAMQAAACTRVTASL